MVKPGESQPALGKDADDEALARLDRARHADGGTPTAALRLEMQRAMQSNCAVFRTGDVLNEGVDKLRRCWGGRADIHVSDRSMIWNSDLVETLELDDLLSQAVVSMSSAKPIARKAVAPMRGRTSPSATTRNG